MGGASADAQPMSARATTMWLIIFQDLGYHWLDNFLSNPTPAGIPVKLSSKLLSNRPIRQNILKQQKNSDSKTDSTNLSFHE